MKNSKPHTMCGGGLIFLLLMGCVGRSPEPRLYVFAPHDGWSVAAARSAADSLYHVRIAPVQLPVYLDRPHLVTRIADNELQAHSQQRWGIPLDAAVRETLAGAIAGTLPAAYVDVSPPRAWSPDGYGVQVEIIRFEGVRGGVVELVAQWRVTDLAARGNTLIKQLDHYQAETQDDGFETYVETVRDLSARLGRDIAKAIAAIAPN